MPGWLWNGPDPKDAIGKFKVASQDGDYHRLSPSSLREYLECPFRFYLKRVAGLKDPYEPLHEMDALKFGTLVHEVFARFAGSDRAHSSDAEEIGAFLSETTEQLFRERFGAHPGLPVTFQKGIILNRLSHAAQAQAEWRKKGWKIIRDKIEIPFEIPMGTHLRWRIVGRMDRVDENEHTGDICVLDYKTTAEAVEPEKAHWAHRVTVETLRKNPADLDNWNDLQLPLYVAACQREFPGRTCGAAYFALPDKVEQTDILVWDGFSSPIVDCAKRCAESIFQRMEAGVFWPYKKKIGERDDEYRVFLGDIERHLDERLLKELKSHAERFEETSAASDPGVKP